MAQWFSSLRVRLVLLVLLASLPALALTIYSNREQRKLAEASVEKDILRLSQLATINQETFVENTRIFLVALSHMDAVRSPDLGECQELFTHLFTEHYPQFASFYVADLDGHVVCSVPNTHVPSRLKECEHYNMMITSQDYVVSNYHICEASGAAIMAMGYPVYDFEDNFIRVLNISIDLSWLNDLAAQIDLPAGATLAVFDHKGNYLTHYPEPEKWTGKLLSEDSSLYPLFSRGRGALVARDEDHTERIYATTPMKTSRGSVTVIMGVPTSVAYAEANRITTRNLIFLVSATLLAAAAAFVLAEILVMRQTQRLLHTTKQLAEGDLSARTTISPEAGEFGQLAHSFDQMASALEQRDQERLLAEDAMREYAAELERSNRELQDFANIASHDMQEPLRKIMNFSELLRERYDEGMEEGGRDYLMRMERAALHLYNLINELLAYSRINTRAQPFVQVDLNEITQRVLADLELQIEESKARLEVSELPCLEADPTQMYQLVQNLVSNALKFRKAGCQPVIKISSPDTPAARGKVDGMVLLTVSDNGIGFDEKYLDKIFQPFQRLHPKNEYDGTGIGLAICRKIIERHGGSITARSKPGQGAEFVVSLPASQYQEKVSDGH
jgi:signal transduction histidine kinase